MQFWIKSACLMTLGACLALTFSGCGLISKLKARDQLNKGAQFYKDKKFEDAVTAFKESIQYDPNLINAYLYLATTYSAMYSPGLDTPKNKKTADEAINTYKTVLNSAGDRTDLKVTAMTSIAVLYEQLENIDEAKAWCRKLLELQPDNVEALYRIAVIDFKQSFNKTGNTGDGVKQLSDEERERLLKLIDEGITVLNKALEKNPEYANAVNYLNLLYREQAKFTKDETQRRELLRKADQLAMRGLELSKKEEAEKIKKGKTKIK